jgi:hypothetical protein
VSLELSGFSEDTASAFGQRNTFSGSEIHNKGTLAWPWVFTKDLVAFGTRLWVPGFFGSLQLPPLVGPLQLLRFKNRKVGPWVLTKDLVAFGSVYRPFMGAWVLFFLQRYGWIKAISVV